MQLIDFIDKLKYLERACSLVITR